uniref:Uncharacterized protein n=1 Tax=Rhizophora mucronata TaxID=61149 RepID=A0A2P2P1C6_RHIMU
MEVDQIKEKLTKLSLNQLKLLKQKYGLKQTVNTTSRTWCKDYLRENIIAKHSKSLTSEYTHTITEK